MLDIELPEFKNHLMFAMHEEVFHNQTIIFIKIVRVNISELLIDLTFEENSPICAREMSSQ